MNTSCCLILCTCNADCSRVKSCRIIACCLAHDVDKRRPDIVQDIYGVLISFAEVVTNSDKWHHDTSMSFMSLSLLMQYFQLCKQARHFILKNDNLNQVNSCYFIIIYV